MIIVFRAFLPLGKCDFPGKKKKNYRKLYFTIVRTMVLQKPWLWFYTKNLLRKKQNNLFIG